MRRITPNFPVVKRRSLKTLQVNLGYRCNQSCNHCHVNAGPFRTEMMSNELIELIPKVLHKQKISILDITGGAPELHKGFNKLVETSRKAGVEVIDRCNLTILNEPGFEYLASFLAENSVTIIASLPCYNKENVNKQRGYNVFERSIDGLKKLNEKGYGKGKLPLHLVYNPQGPVLPPPQSQLEKDYKIELKKLGINFDKLFTITNMPIQRFAHQLELSNKLDSYQQLLEKSYNPDNLNSVMCRDLISVNWEGKLYDCDFNQQIGMQVQGKMRNLVDLSEDYVQVKNELIRTSNHCFGCTAGSGSSCGGSLQKNL